MAACYRCGSDDVPESCAGPASVCAGCVRSERQAQGLAPRLLDDPENVALVARILGAHRPAPMSVQRRAS